MTEAGNGGGADPSDGADPSREGADPNGDGTGGPGRTGDGNPSGLLPRGPAARWALIRAVARSVLGVLVLGVAYFVLPLGGVRTLGEVGILALGLIAIVALVIFQVGQIVRADYPGLRAIEALAFTASLLLFAFSVTYDVMDAETSAAFNVALSRLDALYFTVTVFGTVGFGDITAHSEAARAVVTVQILFDFVFLGVAVRLVAGAVQIGRRRVAGN